MTSEGMAGAFDADDDPLFAPDPVMRWAESQRRRADPAWSPAAVRERYPWWPRYWFGSVNAWLVFLGPSPGASGSRAINWERDQFPTLGRLNEHVRAFPDSQGFWDRLREWIAEGYGRGGVFKRKELEAALAMSMLGNVSEARFHSY